MSLTIFDKMIKQKNSFNQKENRAIRITEINRCLYTITRENKKNNKLKLK